MGDDPETHRGWRTILFRVACAPILLLFAAMVLMLALLAVVVALLLAWTVAALGSFDWRIAQWVIFGALVAVGLLCTWAYVRMDDLDGPALVSVVVLVAVAGAAAAASYVTHDHRRVQRYCSYGAISRAQLEGCTSHVSFSSFKESDTEAARYGRYERATCGSESGPFCGGRSERSTGLTTRPITTGRLSSGIATGGG